MPADEAASGPRLDDVDRELQAHLAEEAEEQREAGLSREEAGYAAQRAFGNLTRVKEEIHDMSPWRWVEELGQDASHALRILRKNAGVTAVAVVSLAVGIGATTAMFSLVNGVLLKPLHFREPARLVRVTGYYPKGAVAALQERSRTLEVAGALESPVNLTGQGDALRLWGSTVSANFFSVLGVPAAIGRTFAPGDDRPGHDGLVLLGHSVWQAAFRGEASVVGRVIRIDGVAREVVGVMPPDFAFPATDTQVWTPLRIDPTDPIAQWGAGFMPLVARLRPDASPAQAQGELRSLAREIASLFPFPMAANWNADVAVLPLQEDVVGNVRGKLLVLLGAVLTVLLIACVNVASLLLALAAVRRRELALRAALGAGRGRLVRQLLTESLVLALGAAGLGLALAHAALGLLKSALPLGLPRLAEVGIDGRVVAFVAGLAVLTAVAFGMAPALHAARTDLARAIKTGAPHAADRSSLRLRSSLIVAEVGLAVVLVTGAGLLIRSLWRLTQVDPGFQPARIVTVRVSPSDAACPERAACIALYDERLRQARGISGVAEAAAINAPPLGGHWAGVPLEIEGQPLDPASAVAPLVWSGAITPEYFRMLGIPVVRGRVLEATDGADAAPVVVVSESTARAFWPGEDPIGKHLRVVWDREWRAVVGVVGDVRQHDLNGRVPPEMLGSLYMPYPQSVTTNRRIPAAMTLMLRYAGEPRDLGAEVHALVRRLNPDVPVTEMRTLDAIVTSSTSPSRSLAWLFAGFGACALLLAAIGVYGVVSYSTAQRTYEIGVRMALGATRGRIFGLTLAHSLRLVLAGLAVGAVAALLATQSLAGFLFGVTPTDPGTFAAVGGLLVVVSLLAGFVPARRAASVDPLGALRAE